MPRREPDDRSLRVRPGQPLIGVVVREDGEKVTHYFTEGERSTDHPTGRARRTMRSFAGIWGDLDWDEAERALDVIRHGSKPTPPLAEL